MPGRSGGPRQLLGSKDKVDYWTSVDGEEDTDGMRQTQLKFWVSVLKAESYSLGFLKASSVLLESVQKYSLKVSKSFSSSIRMLFSTQLALKRSLLFNKS